MAFKATNGKSASPSKTQTQSKRTNSSLTKKLSQVSGTYSNLSRKNLSTWRSRTDGQRKKCSESYWIRWQLGKASSTDAWYRCSMGVGFKEKSILRKSRELRITESTCELTGLIMGLSRKTTLVWLSIYSCTGLRMKRRWIRRWLCLRMGRISI